jgi:hypothetical protein
MTADKPSDGHPPRQSGPEYYTLQIFIYSGLTGLAVLIFGESKRDIILIVLTIFGGFVAWWLDKRSQRKSGRS